MNGVNGTTNSANNSNSNNYDNTNNNNNPLHGYSNPTIDQDVSETASQLLNLILGEDSLIKKKSNSSTKKKLYQFK